MEHKFQSQNFSKVDSIIREQSNFNSEKGKPINYQYKELIGMIAALKEKSRKTVEWLLREASFFNILE